MPHQQPAIFPVELVFLFWNTEPQHNGTDREEERQTCDAERCQIAPAYGGCCCRIGIDNVCLEQRLNTVRTDSRLSHRAGHNLTPAMLVGRYQTDIQATARAVFASRKLFIAICLSDPAASLSSFPILPASSWL